MAVTVEKALLNNQSSLQNFALVEELDEQAAEIISGGHGRHDRYDRHDRHDRHDRYDRHDRDRRDGEYNYSID